ncbi:MAG: hypothetical protein OXD46_15565 [Chloroflexi bacterium]|nr:hypothetical protein [Chloroflexota bacterium]
MNIFETIETVTGGTEQFHSQFLADALRESLCEDRSLFDGVWRLATPDGWAPPDCAEISTEEAAGEGRVDICIRSDHPVKRIVGIEVKTKEESAESGQLEKYFLGLRAAYQDHCVSVSYLTPFNECRAGVNEDKLRTVRIFKEFSKSSLAAKHVSWLDVADIDWDGTDLWKQHQAYVRNRISSCSLLKESSVDRDRGLCEFFGANAEQGFFDELAKLGILRQVDGVEICLSEYRGNLSDFAVKFVNALEILIKNDRTSPLVKKKDKFTEGQREPFLDSEYREVHDALFNLSQEFSHVWVEGEGNYGVRTAHEKHRSGGVSIVTSRGSDRLLVGRRR